MGIIYLNILRPVQHFFLPQGSMALKLSLLALYNGDISSAKRLHRHLSYPLSLYSYSLAMIMVI